MQVAIKTGDVTEIFDSENSEITLYLSEGDNQSISRNIINKHSSRTLRLLTRPSC